MADKFMYIHNDDTQNYPFCRLKFVVETFESTNKNWLKSPKLLSKRIRKLYYKTLGTIVINSPMSPPSFLFMIWNSIGYTMV